MITLDVQKESTMRCSQCGVETRTNSKICHICGCVLKKGSNQGLTRTHKPHLRDIVEITEQSGPTIATEACDILKEQKKEITDEEHYPWRRFFARTADLLTLGSIVLLLLLFIITYFPPPKNIDRFTAALENPIIFGIVLYLFWLPAEAGFIATIGTTPAKWIFGISVLSGRGEKLSYTAALRRSYLVWTKGEGLGILLVVLFTRIFAYRRLKKTGTTLWDTSVGSVVTHKKWGLYRAIASVFIVLTAVVIFVILNLWAMQDN
jgi:uncharacterized RDD family membrane protein YckC